MGKTGYNISCSLGGLSLAIEGPSKADISCTDNQDGTCTVSYLPVLPGDYNIIVKYNDKHIPGSPFMAKITGALGAAMIFGCKNVCSCPLFKVKSSNLCLSAGDDSMRMSHLKVGSAADIPLDIGELDLSQLTTSLTTPSGREEPCLLKMLRNGHVGKCCDGSDRMWNDMCLQLFQLHLLLVFSL